MKKALKNYLVGLVAIAVVLIFVSLATSLLTMFFTNLIFKMGLLFATVWRVQYLFFSGVAFLYETFMYVRTLVSFAYTAHSLGITLDEMYLAYEYNIGRSKPFDQWDAEWVRSEIALRKSIDQTAKNIVAAMFRR